MKFNFFRRLGLVVIAVIISLHVCGADWYVTTVDTTPYSGSYGTSIALDSLDYPHIAYCRYKTDGLMYASWDGEEWQLEKVFQSGTMISLALDSKDRPHISFWWGCLGYAWKDSVGWHYTKADSTVWMERASIALDSSDLPHIAYNYYIRPFPNYLDGINYAYYDGVSWHRERVDTAYRIRSASIAVNSSNQPCIAYDYTWGIKYAERDSTGWNFEIVQGCYCFKISLALDSLDRPHIAFGGYNPSNETWNLYYATKRDTGWHTEIVSPEFATIVSLNLDRHANPHISYHDGCWLKYAGWDGISWCTQRVDSIRGTSGVEYSYPSIAVDKDGYAHISYPHYVGGNKLRYATGPGVTGVSEELEERLSKTTLEVFPLIAVNGIKVAYSLEKGGDINVSVYNILGQRVATLVSEKKVVGKYVSYWSFKDDNGKVVRNGIYFCSLRTRGCLLNRKFIVIK
jgi:hypothetical protein